MNAKDNSWKKISAFSIEIVLRGVRNKRRKIWNCWKIFKLSNQIRAILWQWLLFIWKMLGNERVIIKIKDVFKSSIDFKPMFLWYFGQRFIKNCLKYHITLRLSKRMYEDNRKIEWLQMATSSWQIR